jgi:hypothetical protein
VCFCLLQVLQKQIIGTMCSCLLLDCVTVCFPFVSSPPKTNDGYNVFLDSNIFPRRCFTIIARCGTVCFPFASSPPKTNNRYNMFLPFVFIRITSIF